jgi:hypothetical protein
VFGKDSKEVYLITSGRIAIVAFAPLQWGIACAAIRITQVQIRSQLVRVVLVFAITGLMLGSFTAQVSVYRFLTGNHGDLKHDPFAFPVLVAQGFITGAILMGYGIWQMAKDRKKRMAGEK